MRSGSWEWFIWIYLGVDERLSGAWVGSRNFLYTTKKRPPSSFVVKYLAISFFFLEATLQVVTVRFSVRLFVRPSVPGYFRSTKNGLLRGCWVTKIENDYTVRADDVVASDVPRGTCFMFFSFSFMCNMSLTTLSISMQYAYHTAFLRGIPSHLHANQLLTAHRLYHPSHSPI